MSARDRLLTALDRAGCTVSNGGRAATCPAHEDHSPSLSIGQRKDRDGVLIRCHTGCTTLAVLDALGLTEVDLFDEPRTSSARPQGVATYDYADEVGTILYQKVRMVPKDFRQRRPVGTGWDWKLGTTRRVLYRLPDVAAAIAEGRPVYVAEGEKDADALCGAGVAATCWTEGAWRPGQSAKWRPEYTDQLTGAHVVIVRDRDEAGEHTATTIATAISGAVASARIVEAAEGKDAHDHLTAGHTVAQLVAVDAGPVRAPITLDEAHAVFLRWLGADYDTDALDAVLAVAAVERMTGDPLWLLLVSGSGNAKTETVQALAGAGAMAVSTIASEGALLSATSKREVGKHATGGLLREIGDRGVLVIKDVTSILSMNRDQRAAVLGALREVYDGGWTRSVGTDGGKRLEWSGRVGLVGAVTTAWDAAHTVIAACGDRFVLVRMDSSTGRIAAGRQAIGNTGHEVQMRAALSAAVGGVIAGATLTPDPVTDAESDRLLAAADLVTLARTAVEFDYRGDVIDAHAPEMPTRFAKQLAQILLGAVAIGVDRDDALQLAIRCARDSMPPMRLAIVDDLAANPDSTTAQVRKRIGKPRTTVDRQLQALHMLGVAECEEEEHEYAGQPSIRWRYSLANGIDPGALQKPSRNVTTHLALREKTTKTEGPSRIGTDISGHFDSPSQTKPGCSTCGEPMQVYEPRQTTHPGCSTDPDGILS